MNQKSAAAPPHSLPSGEARDHHELVRDVSEARGEVRTLKWASALAFVAIVGTMGFFYKALETFNEGQNDTRETLGAIHEQTKLLGEHLFRKDEHLEQLGGRLRGVENGVVQVNARLDQVDWRLGRMDGRLDKMDGRLDKMDGRLDRMERWRGQMDGWREQTDARLANMEELIQVLVAGSADRS